MCPTNYSAKQPGHLYINNCITSGRYFTLQNYRPFLALCQQCSPIIYKQYLMFCLSNNDKIQAHIWSASVCNKHLCGIITRAHMPSFSLSFLLLVFFCLFAWPSRKRFHWRWSLISLMFPGKHWNKYHPRVR